MSGTQEGGGIALRNVTHFFETPDGPFQVLDDFTMVAEVGSFLALVGPSGCGKSTVTRLVSGLLTPSSGDILLGGSLVTGPRPNVGMAFQNPVMLEWRDVVGNIILPLEIVARDMPQKARVERARELLELVSLSGFENKRPSELSGGMRQRVSLCRALVHRPDVLILDEPFGALDAFTREELWLVMQSLRKKEQFTCLLITHDLRESVFLSDEVLVMSDRPARLQYQTTIELGTERSLKDLYSVEVTELLAHLRHQIEVAQGRIGSESQIIDS